MKKLAALFALLQFLMMPAAAQAQDYASARSVSTVSWVEEWDSASESWVRVADRGERAAEAVTTVTTHIVNGEVVSQTTKAAATRYAVPLRSQPESLAIAHYGPFRVVDGKRAVVVGTTGPQSPQHFDAMMRDFPQLEVLELVDAGGTSHDIANLEVGRRIRAAGLTTHVPDGGSARSGGVELFLAGENRTMASGAQFAVHSWLDNYGREPADFAPDAPANRLYLDYYKEMGMSEERAQDFYAMTNSVPHSSALWLRANEMENWIAPERAPAIIREPAMLMVTASPLATPKIIVEPVTLAIAFDIAPVIDYADVTRFAFAKPAHSELFAS
ncbi:alpha/beta hydrolase [Erythrobacter crassostreae]|uniref:Alpha/beta hydrolase n=1 Tax=Erythrobacter crassostreae TaxID=2828328 RepID=A0A9X1F1D3_9SPHN|nr:alpha/beta hydrolase [Erythrobacter crassostrea]MBV7258231.1 alpha/beta hydrolase [Erythrobacter crassostrea]